MTETDEVGRRIAAGYHKGSGYLVKFVGVCKIVVDETRISGSVVGSEFGILEGFKVDCEIVGSGFGYDNAVRRYGVDVNDNRFGARNFNFVAYGVFEEIGFGNIDCGVVICSVADHKSRSVFGLAVAFCINGARKYDDVGAFVCRDVGNGNVSSFLDQHVKGLFGSLRFGSGKRKFDGNGRVFRNFGNVCYVVDNGDGCVSRYYAPGKGYVGFVRIVDGKFDSYVNLFGELFFNAFENSVFNFGKIYFEFLNVAEIQDLPGRGETGVDERQRNFFVNEFFEIGVSAVGVDNYSAAARFKSIYARFGVKSYETGGFDVFIEIFAGCRKFRYVGE